jgi:hypothetical protein
LKAVLKAASFSLPLRLKADSIINLLSKGSKLLSNERHWRKEMYVLSNIG